VAGPNALWIGSVDQMDDEHIARFVHVDRKLVWRLAGQHTPQGHAPA
jgi:hypothetical protein